MNKTKKVKVKKQENGQTNIKKVLTVIIQKDFHKNNIVNMDANKGFIF